MVLYDRIRQFERDVCDTAKKNELRSSVLAHVTFAPSTFLSIV